MRNRLFVLIALIATASLFSCAEKGEVEAADIIACGTFDPETHICDKRDGNVYKFRQMPDKRYWMVENLNYKPSQGLSKCYGETEENCKNYGRLYDWQNIEGICPDGWRVPFDDEWEKLETSMGKDCDRKLKAIDGWEPYYNSSGERKDGNGEDSYKFSALPAGAYMIGRRIEDGDICEKIDDENGKLDLPQWNGLGEIAIFISQGENTDYYYENDVDREPSKFCWASNTLKSIRCIKEE